MKRQTLRPYQEEAVAAVFDAMLMGRTRILYTQPTGTGKTTTMAEIARICLDSEDARLLLLAHRRELITQMYERVRDHCGLGPYDIGAELADWKAPRSARVIVGSVQTLVNAARIPHFVPTVVIVDEAHRAAAPTYKKIFDRYDVGKEGGALLIGCTATAKRTDRASLYAIKPDGGRVELFDKRTKQRYPADPAECVFEAHCYEYGLLEATEQGYLVPVRGHTVQTETDLSGVETDRDGDFKDGQLAKAVDNAERTLLAVNAWKQVAEGRPTIVFCAGVEHAHHAAELWRQAGYTAAALDGETETAERHTTLEAFRRGEIDVLANCGLFTEGMDAPVCSCVVHLRPTKSWNLFVQMTGRGLRVLPGVVDGLASDDERVRAIAASGKPDCLVIDLVDLCEKQDLCTLPSILDLPASLDLQGETVDKAKKLLDEFEEVRERVIGECPTTFRELQVRLAEVNLLTNSKAQNAGDWAVREGGGGFRFRRVPVGYQAELTASGEKQYRLTVRRGAETLLDKVGQPSDSFDAYLKHAGRWIGHAVGEHQASISRGTLQALTPKQIGCLRANGHTREDIDRMTQGYAKKLIAQYMNAWKARQEAQEGVGAA